MDEQKLKEIEKELSSWNDMNWRVDVVYELIEEVRKQKRENVNLQKEIGKYAGQIQELVGKQQALCREGLTIAQNMFRTDLD